MSEVPLYTAAINPLRGPAKILLGALRHPSVRQLHPPIWLTTCLPSEVASQSQVRNPDLFPVESR
jgi:hypothetical protein